MAQYPRTLPRYIQIADALQEQIDGGLLAPGARLPSERALSEMFGVTRMTLRQALAHLTVRGSITRRRGSGTFVAPHKVALNLDLRTSPHHSATTNVAIVVYEMRQATQSVAGHLDVPARSDIHYIAWRHKFQAQPLLLEQVSLAAAYLSPPRLAARREVDLEDYLRHEYGVHTRRAHLSLEAVAANTFEAQLLQVTTGCALLLARSVMTTVDGRPLGLCANLYRSDRVQFRVDNMA